MCHHPSKDTRMSGSDEEELDEGCEPDILGEEGTKNLKVQFSITATFWAIIPPPFPPKKIENWISGHSDIG